jgi:DNA mismatch repair protein MutH
MAKNFDQADATSIESFGKKLLRTTLRKTPGELVIPGNLLDAVQGGTLKGGFGSLVEKYYYGINPGNESRADFDEAKVELKTTPIRRLIRGGFAAKERLVLNIINYVKEAELDFEESSFYTKNNLIMLIGYLYEKGVPLGDLKIAVASLLDFKKLPELDQKIIREDWEKISTKIKEGRAHELSEGDTFYLGACTKSANSLALTSQYGNEEQAKPRAYSFKAGYMSKILNEMIRKHAEEGLENVIDTRSSKTFEEQVLGMLSRYYGKTNVEIEKELGIVGNMKSKSYVPNLVKKILGISGTSIKEFEAAEVKMKTIQVDSTWNMKEHVSFPTFKLQEIIKEKWDADESEGELPANFQKQIEQRFLFVIFQYDKTPQESTKKFIKAFFWSMPYEDREKAKKVWNETLRKISSNQHNLPGAKQNDIAHVRPHAKDGKDVDFFPDGSTITKQAFWLNKEYLMGIIKS